MTSQVSLSLPITPDHQLSAVIVSVKREEKPVRLDLASKMNGHDEEANGEYEFTRKISNSFAESIMASSPTKVPDNNEKPLVHIYVLLL